VHVKDLNDRLPTVFGLSGQEWFLHIYVQCAAITDEGCSLQGGLLISEEKLRKI
jgi:hypothetical protein